MKKSMCMAFAGSLALVLAGCRSVDTKASGYQTSTVSGVPVTASPGVVATQQPVLVQGVGARPSAS